MSQNHVVVDQCNNQAAPPAQYPVIPPVEYPVIPPAGYPVLFIPPKLTMNSNFSPFLLSSNDNFINIVGCTKYLGVFIDNKLNFKRAHSKQNSSLRGHP